MLKKVTMVFRLELLDLNVLSESAKFRLVTGMHMKRCHLILVKVIEFCILNKCTTPQEGIVLPLSNRAIVRLILLPFGVIFRLWTRSIRFDYAEENGSEN